jgi:FkbM family methyltransferase
MKYKKNNKNKNNINYFKYIIIIIIVIIVYYIYVNYLKGLYFFKKHNIQYNNIIPSLYVYNEIFIDGDYDMLLPKNDWVIFDVGSNIGLYSLYLNDNYSNLKIHTFEPIKQLYTYQQNNINNNLKNNNKIFINNFGLGEKNSNTIINYYPYADGLSTINNDMDNKKEQILKTKCKNSGIFNYFCNTLYSSVLYNDKIFTNFKENIRIIRMSEYINNLNIKKIDLIKIDVEGYELNVLQGINKEQFKFINYFIIEVENYNNSNLNDIISLLKDNNFTVKNYNPDNLWTMLLAINNNLV